MRAARDTLALALAAVGACYSPSPPAGAQCANGVCPDPLVCSAANTCERPGAAATDGAVPADVLVADAPDGALPIDARRAGDAATDALGASPFAPLDGAQVSLACQNTGSGLCPCAGSASETIQLLGSAAVSVVTLRVRAVSESGTYGSGAQLTGEMYAGGAPAQAFLQVIELSVSSPLQHYYLNSGSGIPSAIDYTASVPIAADATLTLFMTGQDGEEERNANGSGVPITFAGVATTPSPFNGEFAQINVVSTSP